MSKAEKIIAYIMQQLSLIGENFGWQMGKVGANYENGYMKCNQDCKAHFRKDEIKREIEKILENHIVESDKMIVTNADRIRNMSEEELAEFLCKFDACQRCSHNSDNACYTKNCDEIGITEKWLKEKVE